MDLESTFSTIAGYVPEELEDAVSAVGELIPTEISFVSMLQFLLYFAAASLILGVLSRFILGKRSSLNHSLSSAMGILFIYVITVVIYTFKPLFFAELLSPLPFVNFYGEYIVLFPFAPGDVPSLCSGALSLIILAFLVNLLDTFLPKGKSIIGWYLLRFVTVILAMGLHYVVHWAFNTYLPDVLVTYAPMILLFLLVFMLLLSVLNLLLGVALTVMNPIFGAIYTFFFSNIIGKQLTKAVFSSLIVGIIFFLMDYFGYTAISIAASALVAYAPLLAVLLVLWYLIGHVL